MIIEIKETTVEYRRLQEIAENEGFKDAEDAAIAIINRYYLDRMREGLRFIAQNQKQMQGSDNENVKRTIK